MDDEMSATATAGSVKRDVYRSAGALTLGLSLLLGGVVILLLAGVLAVVAGMAPVFPLLAFIGMATTVLGVVQFLVGIYQCADNIDRVAKALIDGQRD